MPRPRWSTSTCRPTRAATRRRARWSSPQRFPSFERLRNALLRRLQDPRCGTDLRKQRGKEAALALLNTRTGTAGSLVLVDTGKEHKSAATKGCGLVSQTYIGRFLAIGQQQSLTAARALAQAGDKGASLARNPDFAKAMSGLPADRVADAWASADGVRRLLAPQGGVLGAAGVLLDQPGLKGAGVGLVAHEKGARIVVRSELDPKAKRPQTFKPFEPTLQDADAQGRARLPGRERALHCAQPRARRGRAADRQPRSAAAAGGAPARPAVGRPADAGGALDPAGRGRGHAHRRGPGAGADGRRSCQEGHRQDARAARDVPIARLLGKTARFEGASVAGHPARVLKAGPISIAYAVFDDRLVISTSTAGIAAVARKGDHLDQQDSFKSVAGDAPGKVSSLLFLDFTELLRLGEQTGLGDSRAYQSVRDDLQKVRAVGAWSSGSGDESNAEINLSIP